MKDSILDDIKDYLGISDMDNAFDSDVIMNINLVLSNLYQMGVSSPNHITGSGETWDEIFPDQKQEVMNYIKPYIYMKTRVLFDTPSSTSVTTALQEQITELEWRLNAEAEGDFDV